MFSPAQLILNVTLLQNIVRGFPSFPAPSYDNPISSYDAPIYNEYKYTEDVSEEKEEVEEQDTQESKRQYNRETKGRRVRKVSFFGQVYLT